MKSFILILFIFIFGIFPGAGGNAADTTQETLEAMRSSDVEFSRVSYRKVLNESGNWKMTDARRLLIQELLREPVGADIWFPDGTLESTKGVQNESQLAITLHTLAQFRRIVGSNPQMLERFTSIESEWPSYYLGHVFGSLISQVEHPSHVRVVEHFVRNFPVGSQENMNQVHAEYDWFKENIVLSGVSNNLQADFIKELIDNRVLVRQRVTTRNWFRYFSKKAYLINSRADFDFMMSQLQLLLEERISPLEGVRRFEDSASPMSMGRCLKSIF